MFPTERHINIVRALDKAYDNLVAKGFHPYNDPAYKRRDPQEPGRTIKEAYEDRLQSLVLRYFNRQKREVRRILEERYPDRKATIPLEVLITDDLQARFYVLFAGMATSALDVIYDNAEFQFDVLDYSVDAARVAKEKVATMLDQINETTRKNIQEAVAAFVDTPGMTVGDVIKTLPFDKLRARSVAVTEITRLFAEIELEVGKKLQGDFPDVRVVKRWFTNWDDRVCPICSPLHGMVVSIESNGFTTEEGGLGIEAPPAHVNCRCWISTRTVIGES